MTTIVFIRDKNARKQEISGYIDYAHRLKVIYGGEREGKREGGKEREEGNNIMIYICIRN